MSYYNFILLPIVFSILIACFVNPIISLYLLSLDTWITGRITDAGTLFGFFTINKLVSIIASLALIINMSLKRHVINFKLITSNTSICMYLFALYIIISSYIILDRVEYFIINNLIFYVLTLLLVGNYQQQKINRLIIAIILGCLFITIENFTERIITHGSLLADHSNGSRIQPGFHVLLCLPFLFSYAKTNSKFIHKFTTWLLIFLFSIFVLSCMSRTLFAILSLIWISYSLAGYFNIKFFIIIFPVVIVIIISILFGSSNFSKNLMRMDIKKDVNITKMHSDNLTAITSGRSILYEIGWKRFKQRPIFGTGYDSFKRPKRAVMNNGVLREGSALHSSWLQILSETGIVGAFLYLSLFIATFINFIKNFIKCEKFSYIYNINGAVIMAMFIFFLSGIFDNFGFSYRIFYFFIALSVIISNTNNKNINVY